MARAGLGPGWDCSFANDFDLKKAETYRRNWGAGSELYVSDIRTIDREILPKQRASLAWGSFPCQDLSLAGNGIGFNGNRSSAFFAFWDVIAALQSRNKTPDIVAVENVIGAIHAQNGADFQTICRTFSKFGYRFGAFVIDASHFVPQSRKRIFVVGVRESSNSQYQKLAAPKSGSFFPTSLLNAFEKLPDELKRDWIWWKLPELPKREQTLADILEKDDDVVEWHMPEATQKLVSMMSQVNLKKLDQAKNEGKRVVGGIYKRTRLDEFGKRTQRAEVRFDEISGCLRTPGGGSSRQIIMVVQGRSVRTRLITKRETARLMGLSDTYILPENYNEAYQLTGDGVVVPVVRFISKNIFEPLLENIGSESVIAA